MVLTSVTGVTTPLRQSQPRQKAQLCSLTAQRALKSWIRGTTQGAGYSSGEGKWYEKVLNHATTTLVNETPELIFTVAGCENRKHHIERIKQEASSCLLTPSKHTPTHKLRDQPYLLPKPFPHCTEQLPASSPSPPSSRTPITRKPSHKGLLPETSPGKKPPTQPTLQAGVSRARVHQQHQAVWVDSSQFKPTQAINIQGCLPEVSCKRKRPCKLRAVQRISFPSPLSSLASVS